MSLETRLSFSKSPSNKPQQDSAAVDLAQIGELELGELASRASNRLRIEVLGRARFCKHSCIRWQGADIPRRGSPQKREAEQLGG